MVGPTIASAEVDVDFDGSGLDAQARKIATQAGRAFSGEFSDEVNNHMEGLLTPLGRTLSRQMGDIGTASGKSFSDRLGDQVKSQLSGFDNDLASSIVSGDWDAAVRRMGGVSKASDTLRLRLDALAEQGQITDEQFLEIGASFERYRKSLQDSEREIRDVAEATRRQQEATRDADFAMKVYLDRVKGLVTQEKARAKAAEAVEREMRRSTGATKSANREEERSFSLLGRLTGSRNDFLNIVGRTARLLERLPNLFMNVGGGIRTMAANLSKATEGLSGFQRVIAGARAGVSSLVKGFKTFAGKGGIAGATISVVILGGALAALGNLITSLAAGLSTLTGIVTALAASLSYALGGALLSVGPMLGALATGVIGVTVAVVANQDAFAKASKPLSDWVSEVGKAASAQLLPKFTSAVRTLSDVLSDRLTPLLADSAGAVGDWAKSFSDALDSGPMRKNLKVFETTWPNIMRNLGGIFTNVFTGLSGVFAAISPLVERFTGYIEDAAKEFSDWANSAGGKNTVATFFERAWESASLLWDILSNVTDAIGNLFGQGVDSGDSLLESLEGITAEFARWTDSDEGREAISQWFEDAMDLAGTLGEIIGDIAERFDEWDTERSREDFEDILLWARDFVGVIADIVSWLNWFADGVSDINTWFEKMFDNVDNFFSQSLGWDDLFDGEDFLTDWWDGTVMPWWNGTALPWLQGVPGAIGGAFSGAWDGLGDGLTGAWAAVEAWWTGTAIPWFTGLPAQTSGFLSGLWTGLTTGLGDAWGAVVTWWTGTVVPWLQSLPAAVGEMLLGVLDWFIQLPFRVIDALVNLPAMLSTFFTSVGATIGQWIDSMVAWVAALPGRITSSLAGMGGDLTAWANDAWTRARQATVNVATAIVNWVAGLPGRILAAALPLGNRLTAWARDAWTRARQATVNVATAIVNWVAGLPARIISAVSSLGSNLSAWARDAWNRARQAVIDVATSIVNWVRGLPGRIVSALAGLGASLYAFFRSAMQRGYDGMSERGQAVVTWAAGLPGRIVSALGGLGSRLYTAGRELMSGLLDGIIAGWGSVSSYVSGIADRIASLKGPLSYDRRLLIPAGQAIMQGLQEGLASEMGSLARLLGGVTSMIAAAPGGAGRISLGARLPGVGAIDGGGAGRGAAGPHRSVIVQQGAIQVVTPFANPALVAEQMLDRLAVRAG